MDSIYLEPLTSRVNLMLADELAKRGVSEDEYLSRATLDGMVHVIFRIPADMYTMLRQQSGIVAGRDYRVIRGADRRVRKPRPKVESLVKRGIVSRGMPPKKPAHIVS